MCCAVHVKFDVKRRCHIDLKLAGKKAIDEIDCLCVMTWSIDTDSVSALTFNQIKEGAHSLMLLRDSFKALHEVKHLLIYFTYNTKLGKVFQTLPSWVIFETANYR